MYNFKDKVALVTGSSRGIGKATALKLGSYGANVVVHCVNNLDKANEVSENIRTHVDLGNHISDICPDSMVIRADISNDYDVQTMVKQIELKYGRIDFLVNNAGIVDDVDDFHDYNKTLWKRILDVNLTGTFNVTWAVKDVMYKQRFGRIVNVASVAGIAERPLQLGYAVSKAGIISFTKSCSVPFADFNIRINCVAPGAIDTEIHKNHKMTNELVNKTPIKRMGTVDEVADSIIFLLSDKSEFITGTTLIVSGGREPRP